jgi:hypothetical protein
MACSQPNRAAADHFGDPPQTLMCDFPSVHCRSLLCCWLAVPTAAAPPSTGRSPSAAAQCSAHRGRRPDPLEGSLQGDGGSAPLAGIPSPGSGAHGIVYRRDLLCLAHHPSLVYPLCSPRLPSVPSLGGSGAPPVYLMEGGWGGRLRARLTRFYALLQVPTWCCTPPSFGVMRVALSPTTGAPAITSEAAFSCRTDAV